MKKTIIHRFVMIRIVYSSMLLCFAGVLLGQSIDKDDLTFSFAKASLEEFKELLTLPNDANYPDDISKNYDWCSESLSGYGFEIAKLQTPTVPLLLASKTGLAGAPTLLFYFHIDGQPVDGSFWFQEDPYEAVLKHEVEGEGWVDLPWEWLERDSLDGDWRIFARSSSDDKSPFVMFLAALEAMQSEKGELPYNLKIILDFEEEKGSPNLSAAVEANKAALASDALIIFDGPKHVSNEPTIAYGARGITAMTIKVFGPTFPLHSGHYGNYAPNPALRLSKLLASMKDDEGRVTIPGYYDGITISDQVSHILKQVPDDERVIKAKLGIGEIDQVGQSYQEALQYPSLNIRGMSSAWTGDEVRTIVPATATAELDLRLVVESDGDRLLGLVENHIKDQGYHITTEKPTSRERYSHPKICQIKTRGVTKAFRTDFDTQLGRWVYDTMERTFDKKPIQIRTMGGTLPTSPFIVTLEAPALIIPLVNSDNNQHSPNENLRLGNYFDGVKLMYRLLTRAYK